MNEQEHGQGENLVVVYRAPNQYIANLVQGLLASEDIPAIIESRQVPWYDGVMTMGEGYWGDVVVPEKYAEQSRQIIDAYEPDFQDEGVEGGNDQPEQ